MERIDYSDGANWDYSNCDGLEVLTCGPFEVVEMYEELPHGERYSLIYRGYCKTEHYTIQEALDNAAWLHKHN
jgi:hypothetical protein